jgi:hypothetical protein
MALQFKIDIGDWSRDGHNMSESFTVEADAADIYEVRQAYAAAAKAHPRLDPSTLCSEYEESTIPLDIYKELTKLGCPVLGADPEDDDITVYVDGPSAFAELVVWFINLGAGRSMCKLVEDSIESLHGPLTKNGKKYLNVSFGYGLFST